MKRFKQTTKAVMLCLLAFALFWITPDTVRADEYNSISLATDDNWVPGSIDQEDEIDFYKITLPKAGWLTLAYQGRDIGDSYYQLWKEDLTDKYYSRELYTSSTSNPKTDTVTLAMEPGNYYIKVYGYGNHTGNYQIKAAFKAADNNETEPNDEIGQEMPIRMDQKITGFFSEDDEADFYRFDLTQKKRIRIHCISRIRDIYCTLYNSDYTQIDDNNIYTGSEEAPKIYSEEYELNPGTYYVRIHSRYTGRYNLTCSEVTLATGLKISGAKTVIAGKNLKLKATVAPSNATDKKVKWTSGNTSVATVDENTGTVKTYRAGVVNITATTLDASNIAKIYKLVVLPKRMAAPKVSRRYDGQTLINWTVPAGANGVQWQYAKNSKFTGAKTCKVEGSYYVGYHKKIKKGTYYFRVRGYVESTKYAGTWSKARKFTVK